MHAIPRIGINRRRVLRDMFKPQIRKTGKIANVKSQITETALYKKVRAMMTSTGIQTPFGIVLSQKYDMGMLESNVSYILDSVSRSCIPLQHCHKEEDEPSQHCKANCDVDDPFVHLLDRNAEKE
jgi:hypothetical protein